MPLFGMSVPFFVRSSLAQFPLVPGVFGGLSVGMGVAWICLISAEMISGRLGIGYRTWQSYTIVDYPAGPRPTSPMSG